MEGRAILRNTTAFRALVAGCCAFLALLGNVAEALGDPIDTCGYRQAGLSMPAYQVSSSEVGHPWRALYGYCLLGGQRFVLHQDWALSYLDGDDVGSAPGGEGIGIGTDLFVRWKADWRPSLIPYIDAGVGIQYAARNPFPADGSRWMFTLHGGAGWLIPMKKNRQATVAVRYLHMSNAGLTGENSGYDVIHLILGMRWGSSR